MATQIRTSLATILTRLKTLLVADTTLNIPAERVLLTVRRKLPHFQADQDIVLRPRGFSVMAKVTDHAGRWQTTLKRRLDVTCRTRLGIDEADRDEDWLTDEAYGHIAFEEAVASFFQTLYLMDDDQNVILHEPLMLMDAPDHEKDADDELQEWGQSTFSYELIYDQAFPEHSS
jgi:hypothetical protein